jgi:hypothetical protein
MAFVLLNDIGFCHPIFFLGFKNLIQICKTIHLYQTYKFPSMGIYPLIQGDLVKNKFL